MNSLATKIQIKKDNEEAKRTKSSCFPFILTFPKNLGKQKTDGRIFAFNFYCTK